MRRRLIFLISRENPHPGPPPGGEGEISDTGIAVVNPTTLTTTTPTPTSALYRGRAREEYWGKINARYYSRQAQRRPLVKLRGTGFARSLQLPPERGGWRCYTQWASLGV